MQKDEKQATKRRRMERYRERDMERDREHRQIRTGNINKSVASVSTAIAINKFSTETTEIAIKQKLASAVITIDSMCPGKAAIAN